MTRATKKVPAKAAAPKAASTPQSETTSASSDKIGKTALIEQLTARTTLSRTQAISVFDAVLDVAIEALRSGKAVGLPGLGTLSVRETAARQGVRPGTSEKITIPAGKKIGFKIAADLKKGL